MPGGPGRDPAEMRAMAAKASHASKLSRRAYYRLEKKKLQFAQQQAQLALVSQLAMNPAVVGTVAFIGVYEFWQPGVIQRTFAPGATNVNGPSLPNVQGLLNSIQNILFKPVLSAGGLGGQLASAVGTNLGTVVDNVVKDMILASLAAYVATGGNLAGTLQSGSNAVANLIKAGAAGAAAAP